MMKESHECHQPRDETMDPLKEIPPPKRVKVSHLHHVLSDEDPPMGGSRSVSISDIHPLDQQVSVTNSIEVSVENDEKGSQVNLSVDSDEDDGDYASEEDQVEEDTRSRFQVDLPTLDASQREVLIDEARNLGFWPWLEKFSNFTIKSLFQIFNFDLDETISALPDEELLPILRRVFMEKASRRQKRPDINTIEDVIRLLETSQRILIITGAGCSVSCGIPDFRSKNGIYSRLEEFHLEDPQQMFDIDYFKFRPETFYTFAREIYPSNFQPSPSHAFIRLLEQKGKLLRNYTQNIDTLEQKAGISRVIQCHGSFATASCIACGHSMPGTAIEEDIFAQRVPRCPVCPEEVVDALIKPDITFFGQKLPIEFDLAFAEDKQQADLLFVIGSSLKVSPVADVKEKLPHDIPQILINLEALPHMDGFDVQLLGYCDTIVQYLCERLGWELPLPTKPAVQTAPESSTREGDVQVEEQEEQVPPIRQGRFEHQFLFQGAVEYVSSDDEELSVDSESDSESGSSEDETNSESHQEDDESHDQLDDPKVDTEGEGEEKDTVGFLAADNDAPVLSDMSLDVDLIASENVHP